MLSIYKPARSAAGSPTVNTKQNVAKIWTEALRAHGFYLSAVDHGMVTKNDDSLHAMNGDTFSILYDKHELAAFAQQDLLAFISLSTQLIQQHRIIYPCQNDNGDWLLGEMYYCPEQRIMHLDIYNTKSKDMSSACNLISDVLSMFRNIRVKINNIPIATGSGTHGSAIVVIDLLLKLLAGQRESIKDILYTDAKKQNLESEYKSWLCGVHNFDTPSNHDPLTTYALKRNRSFTV